jgi:hypothetical protein
MRLPAIVGVLLAVATLSPVAAQTNPYVGAWNITGTGAESSYLYWLEVKDDKGQLTGLFLNRGGHALPLAVVKIDNGELVFQAGTAGRPSGPEYRARIEGGKLVGRHTLVQRGGGAGQAGQPAPAPTERVVNWIGVRPPTWPAGNANGRHTYGPPVVLFDGKTVDAFGVQNANQPMGWSVVDGVMTNPTPPANNLVSKEKFKDFKVNAEYKVGAKSNSGIYLRGRYELQVLDDLGDTATEPFLTHMAIYGRTAPSVRASKAAGEWQTMEAIVVGNHVTVTLNGQRVHDNAVIIGVTGGALDNDELAPGPLMIQGDHGQVWFRKVVVTPITAPGK